MVESWVKLGWLIKAKNYNELSVPGSSVGGGGGQSLLERTWDLDPGKFIF